jgi:hypothetical protein
MLWIVETTDTFGGQANYSWCDQAAVTIPDDATDRQTVRALRAAAGLTGSSARTVPMGEGYEWRHPGACVVTFAMPSY